MLKSKQMCKSAKFYFYGYHSVDIFGFLADILAKILMFEAHLQSILQLIMMLMGIMRFASVFTEKNFA